MANTNLRIMVDEHDDDTYTASVFGTDLRASGRTIDEALKALASAMARYVEQGGDRAAFLSDPDAPVEERTENELEDAQTHPLETTK